MAGVLERAGMGRGEGNTGLRRDANVLVIPSPNTEACHNLKIRLAQTQCFENTSLKGANTYRN